MITVARSCATAALIAACPCIGASAGTAVTFLSAARSGEDSAEPAVGTPDPSAATAAPATEALSQATRFDGGAMTRCRPPVLPDVRCRATERRTLRRPGEGCPNGHRA